MDSIGQEVRNRRIKLEMTQTELAKRSGISRATINALENGQLAELGVVRLIKIMDQLGLTINIDLAPKSRPTLDDIYEQRKREAKRSKPRQRYRG